MILYTTIFALLHFHPPTISQSFAPHIKFDQKRGISTFDFGIHPVFIPPIGRFDKCKRGKNKMNDKISLYNVFSI